ncbi:CcdC family protein [Paenisporosarcina cavernae]|uniref:Cytochrome c biogenesis protein CcdC n=1 Tax=Paenisporosarcina cavernae TaxID=2320858 RepID=A0A385YUY1_9BACL|nr:cytochrome c biogenesis protein CcdC [Paenisporosarcina cavernae]AYC29498.1 cytochrome c biogenesis protein CcdC [Paenisporosarcina cavernae]
MIFDHLSSQALLIISTVGALVMGTLVMAVRTRAAKKPASTKKIILPPVFMSTGAAMFFFDFFHVPLMQVIEALSVGMLFSIVLIKTSNFEVREGDIYLKQSKAFIFILIGLLVVRIVAKLYLSSSIDVGELSGMFWLLAFGMIVPWRIAMYVKYRKLAKEQVALEMS